MMTATPRQSVETIARCVLMLLSTFFLPSQNRELALMKLLHHPNCISLIASFHSHGPRQRDTYLNLVLEYLPQSLDTTFKDLQSREVLMPLLDVKVRRRVEFTYDTTSCLRCV